MNVSIKDNDKLLDEYLENTNNVFNARNFFSAINALYIMKYKYVIYRFNMKIECGETYKINQTTKDGSFCQPRTYSFYKIYNFIYIIDFTVSGEFDD
jgi:hypothetical protein